MEDKSQMKPKWAACIVSYNDPVSLDNLLNCLNTQSLCPEKVFIVDNNSTQLVEVEQKSNFSSFLIKNESNLGFGVAANIAIKKAIDDGFDKFILFSQDVLIEKDSCEKLINSLDNSISFPKMIDRKNNKIFSLGGFINQLTGKIYLEKKDVLTKFDWADGSCLAFTKKVFEKNNGFNENYFMYFEDVDFCYRAKRNGFKLIFCNTTASQKPNGPSPFYRSRNSLIFAKSNKIYPLSISLVFRNLLGAFRLFFELKFADSKFRIKGIFSGLRFK